MNTQDLIERLQDEKTRLGLPRMERLLDEAAQALTASQERERVLREALRECADDLESEIKARADNELPRRIARDMETVTRARQALQSTEQQGE